jgi:hypothetical protein
VPHTSAEYPESFAYDADAESLQVGAGLFGPVSSVVWEYEISGLKVVQSWLKYRMKKGWGRKSSPLNQVRPATWSATMSDELLELLWVLEETTALETETEKFLDSIIAGDCFDSAELPIPSETERKSPTGEGEAGDLLELMELEDDDNDSVDETD